MVRMDNQFRLLLIYIYSYIISIFSPCHAHNQPKSVRYVDACCLRTHIHVLNLIALHFVHHNHDGVDVDGLLFYRPSVSS